MIVAEHLDKSASSNACLDSLFDLPPLRAQVATPRTVRLCYTLMHAAEVAGFTDLADGEFLPVQGLAGDVESEPVDLTFEPGLFGLKCGLLGF